MTIIYQDGEILLCEKPSGVLTQSGQETDEDSLLTVLSREYGKLWLIHRLDRNVGGILLFARTAAAAARLSADVSSHTAFVKEYVAVVDGKTDAAGSLTHYLAKDARTSRALVTDMPCAGYKKAILAYRRMAYLDAPTADMEPTDAALIRRGVSLVFIRLMTGRFHQIRAQFSHIGHPLLGDRKYGDPRHTPLALFACTLTFPHPSDGRMLHFTLPRPQKGAFALFPAEGDA